MGKHISNGVFCSIVMGTVDSSAACGSVLLPKQQQLQLPDEICGAIYVYSHTYYKTVSYKGN